ncbi:FtsH protease activity modulator HflK [Actimicrobium sp. CCI2.3]|uniref:FtsH protease activity modulator HflK n=1 Tax=Actimicrobium sp. CCI2.3 TaxID=3048616 RepID=UPI002AB49A36|nr:FtsH protease activity modulator HflK [Actimicrobium sp. CCI2.3]MDY7575384.1 FtsH protease activity modulator HflK [Actimicrobium sp. CCI2.3]MEB0021295.1 FtsH protease activity modulator HflK [Actimicrobium sp. CCI2.3]
MFVSLLKKYGLKFSLNDPRWGRGSQDDKQNQNSNQDNRRPPDGPPDLEQLWRDFNVRLNRLIGGKKKNGGGSDSGGNGGGGFNPDMRGAGLGAGVIAAIAAFLWLISGFFIVQEGQTAVVMTFGKVSHMTPAGFNWRWPTPIQSHEIVNVSSVRTVEIGYRGSAKNKQLEESLMLTEDENIIDIQFAVQYRLKNAADWLFNNRDQEELIKQVAESAIREVVGHSKMDFVLYEGREKVALDVGTLMQKILDLYKSGVQVANVTMQGVQPPEQVQAAFDDAVKAGQDRERAKNEGQAYANDVIPKARGAVSRLLQEAEGYKSRVVSTSEGDASRFKQVLVEYEKAPAVTRDRIYLETMQQIFTNTSKVMIDSKAGNNLLYLPLDKLISQSVATDAAGKVTVPAAAAAPATAVETVDPQRVQDSRSRDNRNREAR